MKSNVAETSLEAYHKIELNLGKTRATVYRVFTSNPDMSYTDRNLAYILNWTINRVTPRRGELAKLNLIVKAGVVTDPETGMRGNRWRLKK